MMWQTFSASIWVTVAFAALMASLVALAIIIIVQIVGRNYMTKSPDCSEVDDGR